MKYGFQVDLCDKASCIVFVFIAFLVEKYFNTNYQNEEMTIFFLFHVISNI